MAKIKRMIADVRFWWHRKVLKDDWLYPVDENFELPADWAEVDDITPDFVDFGIDEEDIVWVPSTSTPVPIEDFFSPEEIEYLLNMNA